MREIKFRGKDEDNNWRYGSLATDSIQNAYYIIDNEEGIGKDVLENTIGQYTGLKDKNGKEIYEGDIFSLGDKRILYIVEWIDTAFRGRQNGNNSTVGLVYWQSDIEVIGNIYDNPELLEKE